MRKNSAKNGSALVLAVVVVILAAGLGGAFWSMSIHSAKSSQRLTDEAEAQMICDAGLEVARAALVKWRNGDPYVKYDFANPGNTPPVQAATKYSWNKIFQHAYDADTVKMGMGRVASPDVIREDALNRLNGSATWAYGPDNTANGYNPITTNVTQFGMTDKTTDQVDQAIKDVFCQNRRYAHGAYHLSMRNNDGDKHGDGIDHGKPSTGNPWLLDGPATVTDLQTGTITTLYPGDPDLGPLSISPVIDGDGQAILTVTATLPNGTCRQIEVFLSYPYVGGGPSNAIQDNGDIRLSGNFKVLGQLGKVHANGNVTGNGSSGAQVSQSITASGGTSGLTMQNPPPGGIQSGVPPVPINPVNMDEFLDPTMTKYDDVRKNMFELRKDGTVRKWTNGVAAPWIGPVPGLNHTNNAAEPWKLDTGNNALPLQDAAYWIEGNFSISGSDNGTVTKMTILATGSVDMQGNAQYTSASGLEQLIVAGADVRLRGTATSGLNYTGAIFANEQIAVSGTFNMNGSITAANVTDSPLSAVTSNTTIAPDLTVQGTPTIIYDGGGSIIKQNTDHVNVKGLHRTR
jgi:hypothetical protein